jgi:hypothetical protein
MPLKIVWSKFNQFIIPVHDSSRYKHGLSGLTTLNDLGLILSTINCRLLVTARTNKIGACYLVFFLRQLRLYKEIYHKCREPVNSTLSTTVLIPDLISLDVLLKSAVCKIKL